MTAVGDLEVRDLDACRRAVQGVDFVLHQAALGSVPRSLKDPITTNEVNIGGFLNMLVAARDAGVKSFVYAASSSTYGDHPALPKVEENIGKPLSPYAVTKFVNELYADVFARSYGFETVGLRYFNVFGKRQDPNGAYAAVIPKWTAAMIQGEDVTINGFPSATATASGDQWQFRIYALRFGSDVYRFIFAAKTKTAETDRNFRDTVNSFRRLTLAEIQAARPLRIKIVTVQPGETVETMATRMQGVDRPLDRFRVLNGLDARSTLKPRERVKIVVD